MPYIDRDKIPFAFVHGRVDDVYVSQEKIMQMPIVDAVKVVRCKDCKYAHKITDVNGVTVLLCNYKNAHGMLVENHGYCKWGKRKDGEQDG